MLISVEVRGAIYKADPDAGVVYGPKGTPITGRGGGGYVRLSRHGRYMGYAHRAIWIACHGDIPEGMQINHINGIKSDNRITNLELVTGAENVAHAFATGLNFGNVGELNPCAKLSLKDVEAIRASSESSRVLGERYGVSSSTIRYAKTGRTWTPAT